MDGRTIVPLKGPVKMSTIVQAFKVLEEVARTQPVGVSAVARSMEIPKTNAYRILKALEEAGWVMQRVANRGSLWVLTAAPVVLSQFVAQDSNVKDAARPVMESLRETWSEAVHLAVPQGHEIVIVDQLEAAHTIRIHWPLGQHTSSHASSNGKALLASSRGEQYDRLYPTEFTRYTDQTISLREEFDAELEQVRARGFAITRGELRDDICSVAAAIEHITNPVASISVFMPEYRFPEDQLQELGHSVSEAASQVSKALRGVL